MFPSLILSHQTAETDKGKAERAERAVKRNAASQKVKNWRVNGKPWSALVKRFVWEYYYSYHQISWTRSKQSHLINDIRDNQKRRS
jgi:hypothetical protein